MVNSCGCGCVCSSISRKRSYFDSLSLSHCLPNFPLTKMIEIRVKTAAAFSVTYGKPRDDPNSRLVVVSTLLTPPATAERSVAAALRIWFTRHQKFLYFFFSAIFSESSEPIGLIFGHDAWIGPEGDNKDFHRDSFCSFLIKNQKPPQ